MKPWFAISSALHDSARIQTSQTGDTTRTHVFVSVYITKKTVASIQPFPWLSASKITPHPSSARSTIAFALLDLRHR
jgi:hypothetical protein